MGIRRRKGERGESVTNRKGRRGEGGPRTANRDSCTSHTNTPSHFARAHTKRGAGLVACIRNNRSKDGQRQRGDKVSMKMVRK